MGFNTTLMIYNDSLHHIAKDIEIGRKIESACLSVGMNRKPVNFSYSHDRCCGGAGVAIETHHADGMSIVAVGGNTGSVLSPYAGSYRSDKLEILKKLAGDMGFTLRKKRK